MKVDILNKEGKKAGKQVTLPTDVFGIEPNDHAIYLAVKQYMANQRQGTHQTKEKSQLSGSTRKLHKQKGTGGSRKGSIKNPLFRGGARIFGPKPRTYDMKLNKKVKTLARNSALTYKAKEGLIVLEDFEMKAPKTKDFLNVLNNLKAEGRTLFVTAGNDKNLFLSSRNVPKVAVTTSNSLSTYDIMNAKHLVMTESSIKAFEKDSKKESEAKTAKTSTTKATADKK